MTRVGHGGHTMASRLSLHRFPNEKKVRAQWERAVGRIHLPKNPYLCSQHFSTEDYESFVRAQLMKELTGGRYPRKLKLNAVPTIFPHKADQGLICNILLSPVQSAQIFYNKIRVKAEKK
uniref:THAP-type domain-containing protein n=1 Tax=Poecilia latipinna TaxID=48699 RepID=A0A3B3VZX3_9TELE